MKNLISCHKIFTTAEFLLLSRFVSADFRFLIKAIVVILLVIPLFTPQLLYADSDIQVIAVKEGQQELIVYSEPSSAKKSGALPVHEIPDLSQGKGLVVLEDAMNSRFLKVKVNGNIHWIKAKQVVTTQNYDLGSCEKQNDAVTGNRAAVNCTKR